MGLLAPLNPPAWHARDFVLQVCVKITPPVHPRHILYVLFNLISDVIEHVCAQVRVCTSLHAHVRFYTTFIQLIHSTHREFVTASHYSASQMQLRLQPPRKRLHVLT